MVRHDYHYIVPELEPGQTFQLDPTKLLGEIEEARAIGIETRPTVLGPVTFLCLSKLPPGSTGSPLEQLEALLPVYEELLRLLAAHRVEWIAIEEPILALDLDEPTRLAAQRSLERLSAIGPRPRLLLATYFGELGDSLALAASADLDALHVDLVRAPEQLDLVLQVVGPRTRLSLGVVDGRNVWRTDLDRAHALVRRAVKARGAPNVMVAPSCSLLHVPVDLRAERGLDPELKTWLAFAAQRLEEVSTLAKAADTDQPKDPVFAAACAAATTRRTSTRTSDTAVRVRLAGVTDDMRRRGLPFTERAARQQARFGLPLLPTTTIGSFPQTSAVRKARSAWRAGSLPSADYDAFFQAAMEDCVARQEALGLDVLVHGELERNDMVEHFAELLQGFAITENGWVQSYGSRCVKPPIIFGDVARPRPMTVEWACRAQALTRRPMKGMLTGPVTMLQWSFVRDDQPRRRACDQLALALRDEVTDLEAAGVPMIQVDEPALREGLPLRRSGRAEYLAWAVGAFRLATCGVVDVTQIHTHMCYSEFGDIIDEIAALDADVLSIETSRSRMELLGDFERSAYPNGIGPGVYDIHSPRVPTTEEIVELLDRARRVLPADRLWVNPDCGLKTRGWPEVTAGLTNLVEAARVVRQRAGGA